MKITKKGQKSSSRSITKKGQRNSRKTITKKRMTKGEEGNIGGRRRITRKWLTKIRNKVNKAQEGGSLGRG
jgi:hypothetical protein